MPGFTTHYLFGADAYKQFDIGHVRLNLSKNHRAFALGLQGPDIFFYYLPSYLMHKQNPGQLAHEKDTRAFFAYLLESRTLFYSNPHALDIADAYISGFLGHYVLDCTVHPYVYAFTNYNPASPKKHTEYFGQHAYFETELDKDLLWMRKQMYPSQFHQNKTIHLRSLQKKVIAKMLTYAYRHTYPELLINETIIKRACFWMRLGTRILNDPSGQKKVLARFMEKILLQRPFLSPMLPSDQYRFVADPMNFAHRKWIHPWTKEVSTDSFLKLYHKAMELYLKWLKDYYKIIRDGYTPEQQQRFAASYGNRSFLSGLPLR